MTMFREDVDAIEFLMRDSSIRKIVVFKKGGRTTEFKRSDGNDNIMFISVSRDKSQKIVFTGQHGRISSGK